MSEVPSTGPRRSSDDVAVPWSPAHPLPAPGPVGGLPRPAAPILRDRQAGSPFEAPGPLLGRSAFVGGAGRHVAAAAPPRLSEGGFLGPPRPRPAGGPGA